MIDRIILAKNTLITFVSELFMRAVIYVLFSLGIKGMRTIIIEEGQEVQPKQYSGQLDIGKVIIGKDTVIGYRAFEYCRGITEIIIAKGVKIDACALWKCSGITEVNIAEGVIIGIGAFEECIGITEVNIAKGVTIGKWAFFGCTGISELAMSKGVRIDWGAFDGCIDITELSIAQGVTIGEDTFSFETVERFSMPEPIMYFSRQLRLGISDLVKRLKEKGHQVLNMPITNGGLIPYKGVQSLQSLCLISIVEHEGIKELPMVKSFMRSQKLLASEEIEKFRCFILERDDQCTNENSKANELYAMIRN